MKAITIFQPWASLIACGAKRYETRSWATNYRGPIAIHASKKSPHSIMTSLPHYIQEAMFNCFYEAFGIESGVFNRMPTGRVIATAELMDCRETEDFIYSGTKCNVPENELLFGDWTPGRYAWELANVKMLPEPIPAKGKQRIWNWEGDAT